MASVHGTHPQLLRSVIDINNGQRLRVVGRLRQILGGIDGKRILLLGAAFKPNTDDIRNSPAIELANLLALEGAEITIVDPVVSPERIRTESPTVHVATSVAEALRGAHAVVLATEWPEYLAFDFGAAAKTMASAVFFDTRNAMNGEELTAAGLTYMCVGRPARESLRASAVAELALAGGA
jgi:UDPglucose 6-dehydrogenase